MKKLLAILLLAICFLLISIGVFYYLQVPAVEYAQSFNNQRSEIGLIPLGQDWQLEKIELIESKPTNYLGNWFQNGVNTKLYCQYWLNRNSTTIKAYHKSKWIYYYERPWMWKREIALELDILVNPLDNYSQEELWRSYDFEKKLWWIQLDTLNSERSRSERQAINDSIASGLIDAVICGTAEMKFSNRNYPRFDVGVIDLVESNQIVEKWKID